MNIMREMLWKIGGSGIRQRLMKDSLSHWRIFQATNEETNQQVYHRLRIDRPSLPKSIQYHMAILIEWPYSNDSSFPSGEIIDLMQAFESYLDDLSTDNGLSELVSMRMGFGTREWLYYSCDTDKFMAKFQSLLSNHPQYPISITFAEDPEWLEWEEMVKMWSDAVTEKG